MMFVSVIFLLASMRQVLSEETVTPALFRTEDLRSIENLIQSVLACRRIPGLAVSVVQEGKTPWMNGFGKADMETGEDVTVDTKFAIASLTKAFTSTLLAMLMKEPFEQKSVTWDTPVTKILKDFKFPHQYMNDHATLTDLVSHRLGLLPEDVTWVADVFTRDELMRRVRYMKSKSGFREKFLYNNIVYTIAGLVAEKLSGRSWEETITEKILGPLQMTSTSFYDRDAPDWPNYAKPYARSNDSITPSRISPLCVSGCQAAGPAASLSSTARDMTKWLKFLVSKGNTSARVSLLDENRFMSVFDPVVAHDQMFNIEMPEMPVTHSNFVYGRGWFLSHYRGYRAYWHSGTLYGHETFLTYIPSQSAAIYTSVNVKGPSARYAQMVLHDYISDAIIGKPAWVNSTTACTFPRPWKAYSEHPKPEFPVNKDIPPTRPLADYTGMFGHPLYGNVTVLVNQSNSYLQLNYGKIGRFLLYPTGENQKFYVEALEPLSFLLGLSSKHAEKTYVQFEQEQNGYTIEKVRVTFFNWNNSPVFSRNLKFFDVPRERGTRSHYHFVSGSSVQTASYATVVFVSFLMVSTCFLEATKTC